MTRFWLCLALFALEAHAEDRVAQARPEAEPRIRDRFAKAHVPYPPPELFLRAFKREALLELWAGPKGGPLIPIHTYPICSASGGLGPKRTMSNFHLSLKVSYPNASDVLRGTRGRLGGDIYVHGNCVSIGCIAIEDRPIEEVYLAALDARAAGARRISIHIFPQRLDAEGWKALQAQAKDRPDLLAFWEELVPAFQAFEESHRVPEIQVDPTTGRYTLHTKPAKPSRASAPTP
jgi:murein L,D-transpeptidase YafK